MKLIVGLGNIGKGYNNTRHNVGFMCVDNFVNNFKESSKLDCELAETNINSEKVLVIKPTTYMNNSGIAVRKVMDYYHIDINDILIIQDDLDMQVGTLKLKCNSSSGGHNGIKSIIAHLNSDGFARLKIGISNNKLISTKDYVLGKFSKEEDVQLKGIVNLSKEIIESFITNGLEKTMNKYNTK